jgi:hypothetical protein
MDPDKIELENLSKSFEYFKFASDVDQITDIEELRNITKSYYKLYLKQQELIIKMGIPQV